MRHVSRFPNTVEIAASTLATSLSDALNLRIRAGVWAGGRVYDAVRALLGVDRQKASKELQDVAQNHADPAKEALASFEGPDATVDVTGVHTVDGDVLVLLRLHKAGVQLREPALEVKFVVVVHLNALAAFAVEIVQIVHAKVCHARSRADDSGSFGPRNGRQ